MFIFASIWAYVESAVLNKPGIVLWELHVGRALEGYLRIMLRRQKGLQKDLKAFIWRI